MLGVSEKAERISSCRVSTSGSQKLTEGRLLLQEETRGERMKLLSEEVMVGFVPANGGQQLQWEQAVPRDPWTPLPCRHLAPAPRAKNTLLPADAWERVGFPWHSQKSRGHAGWHSGTRAAVQTHCHPHFPGLGNG